MLISQADERAALDRAVATLARGATEWARLELAERIALFGAVRPLIVRHARAWVDASTAAKGIDPGSPLAGEEWTSGPLAVLYAINRYIRTLRDLQACGRVNLPGKPRTRKDGQLIVPVFPVTLYDRLLFSGISAQTWLPAHVTADTLDGHMAKFYRSKHHQPRVALVLGAGNISAIAPLDVLYKLIACGAVCILKPSPVNEYLAPIFREVFAPLIERNFLAIVTGGSATGAYLTGHRDVDEIHITGSAQTHDAIVFGKSGERRGTPLQKPVTSELGNVSPTIVVPGPWTRADVAFAAEHILTQKMHNGGFNCIAAQVLILSQEWEHSDALIAQIEAVIARTPPRAGYYPGAAERQARAVAAGGANREYDTATETIVPRTIVHADAQTNHPAFTSEAFGSVLTITRLPGADAAAFLESAVAFANDRLYGTLGANMIIDPKTERELGSRFEDSVEALRYGSIAINAWTGVSFLLAETSWGAFPGHTAEDIQSGTGVVHNSFLFDAPQKTVLRGPFYPFPRSVLHGRLTLLPRPPWFVTNKRAADIARRLLAFEYAPDMRKIPGIFGSALRG
ncbi:MAG: aldehyde dehydrogenase family protein [Candidatus Eremiobacteraeota bacterium]|nr:aldehyde dehydrogenase family protein [Candidatus Eremiobacteraeota bacterium]